MASISASGIDCAAQMMASEPSIGPIQRFVRRLSAALIVVALLASAAPATQAERPSASPAAAPAEQMTQSGVTML
jgi:hypothetical protein